MHSWDFCGASSHGLPAPGRNVLLLLFFVLFCLLGNVNPCQSIIKRQRLLKLLPMGGSIVIVRKLGRIFVEPVQKLLWQLTYYIICQILSGTFVYAACDSVAPDKFVCTGSVQVCLRTCAALTSRCLLQSPCAGQRWTASLALRSLSAPLPWSPQMSVWRPGSCSSSSSKPSRLWARPKLEEVFFVDGASVNAKVPKWGHQFGAIWLSSMLWFWSICFFYMWLSCFQLSLVFLSIKQPISSYIFVSRICCIFHCFFYLILFHSVC